MKTRIELINMDQEKIYKEETNNQTEKTKLLSIYLSTFIQIEERKYHQRFTSYMHFPKIYENEEEVEIYSIFVEEVK